MVSSPFILINKNGRRPLLNTAQITAVKDIDLLLTDALRRSFWQYPPEQEIVYLVRVEQPDGATDFLFTAEAERTECFDKLIAAISPSAVIDSAPGLPHTWPELARMVPTPKYTLEGKEYATKAEYKQALDAMLNQLGQDRAEWARRSAAVGTHDALLLVSSPEPSAPKPLRKPRTPRQ
ncbi:hypothetical protein GO988_17395 [Hymenobacter sp. HMF4947]|uniref:Uncharacterized protein n=1 Tax=Hymenobacter ginkgonis TaxID=2682976 RepID=A0A7K1TI51_9BACT|nr:hypothetical protein [Hymenobacter ginkgonis]MVN78107.1 hypothetical protein [Hymenobacter ginkgonis]